MPERFFSPSALTCLSLLEKAGFEAYLVGGCVRDALRGVAPKDFDLCTSAKPDEIVSVFSDYRTIPTGIRHGTVTVLVDSTPFEVTTFRAEAGYSDGRHPDKVRFTKSLTKDLSRRDFTMNAVAWNPRTGFVDPFDGQSAIRAREIRCVGDPDRRFSEDALRMLRAVRFSATLGFTLGEETARAIERHAGEIVRVSKERIRQELELILLSDRPTEGVRLVLAHFGEALFGEDAPLLEPDFPLERLEARLSLRTAAFVRRAADPEGLLRDLRFSGSTIADVRQILRAAGACLPATEAGARRFCGIVGRDLAVQTACLIDILHPDKPPLSPLVKVVSERGDPVRAADLTVTGDDLIAAGIPEGKELGEILRRLLDFVLEDPENNTPELLIKEAKKIHDGS